LWLAGFSFGAAVALHAALEAQPAKLVTVAPPIGRLITQPIARPPCPWLIVQGDRDELVDCEAVQRWAASYAPQAPQTLVMHDAEHFFHGRLGELRSGVLDFLASGA
jgi:alpha/beta superfamily hydrolase